MTRPEKPSSQKNGEATSILVVFGPVYDVGSRGPGWSFRFVPNDRLPCQSSAEREGRHVTLTTQSQQAFYYLCKEYAGDMKECVGQGRE